MVIKSNIVLFDDRNRDNLLPLTFTRPVAGLRVGITTIKEKWELITGTSCSYHTIGYLSKKYPMKADGSILFINASLIPDEKILEQISKLKPGDALKGRDIILAYHASEPAPDDQFTGSGPFRLFDYKDEFVCIRNLWDIFTLNDIVLRDDFKRLTQGRKTAPLSPTNTVKGIENIFIEEGAKVECSTINAEYGPVYIGRHAEIMEGNIIRGPLAMCEHSVLKMGSKIYGAVTIGPHCKVGGEINNSVFTANSNKAHDGFIGNSVIGEWCNIGAGSNNSNLKNNYAKVKLWNYPADQFVNTGLQFCGLIMGDHSKCGINTMFNTGTVVGVSSNIFGSGFPRNFIPSFSWGGAAGLIDYLPEKAIETAKIAMSRREVLLSETDKEIMKSVFELTKKYRGF
jgi:UDP-N-acetylglucosamine diphosphorylase/glucosamine-1-phosphate N-acetyltransferase